jgi:hypothetical protein
MATQIPQILQISSLARILVLVRFQAWPESWFKIPFETAPPKGENDKK